MLWLYTIIKMKHGARKGFHKHRGGAHVVLLWIYEFKEQFEL